MVCRALFPLRKVAALVLPVVLCGGFTAPSHSVADNYSDREHHVDDLSRGDAEVLVEWVIRSQDLVACETATPELRRTQHRYRGRVQMIAYAVNADTALVRSFLRRERLASVTLQPITERQFRRDFARRLGPSGRTPTLLVMANGADIGAFDAGVRSPAGQRGVSAFSAQLDALLNPASARGE